MAKQKFKKQLRVDLFTFNAYAKKHGISIQLARYRAMNQLVKTVEVNGITLIKDETK